METPGRGRPINGRVLAVLSPAPQVEGVDSRSVFYPVARWQGTGPTYCGYLRRAICVLDTTKCQRLDHTGVAWNITHNERISRSSLERTR
jgi:hypothetical protein